MGEWLSVNLYFLANGIGALAAITFLIFAIAAVWGAIRKERFEYRKFMNVHWSVELGLWLLSAVTSAASLQNPEEFESAWSLREFSYDRFVDALDASIILHIVLAAIIYVRLRFNSPDKSNH